jgi:hypothetical protein
LECKGTAVFLLVIKTVPLVSMNTHNYLSI